MEKIELEQELSGHSLYDLVVIGGGINGTGIARDAAGRGLKVLLVEQADLAQATSSASSKLFTADCVIWNIMNSAWYENLYKSGRFF